MASTEEKLLTLLLSVEHLQHTAMEQQKAVADSLAVARETLRGYRDISDGVAKQVRDEVRNEVQKLDVAGLIGERISQVLSMGPKRLVLTLAIRTRRVGLT
ncbi:hypothetical protein ACLB1N_36860, partial [Escherichia coli]